MKTRVWLWDSETQGSLYNDYNLPLPNVGDLVNLDGFVWRVVNKVFRFSSKESHVDLWCQQIKESGSVGNLPHPVLARR